MMLTLLLLFHRHTHCERERWSIAVNMVKNFFGIIWSRAVEKERDRGWILPAFGIPRHWSTLCDHDPWKEQLCPLRRVSATQTLICNKWENNEQFCGCLKTGVSEWASAGDLKLKVQILWSSTPMTFWNPRDHLEVLGTGQISTHNACGVHEVKQQQQRETWRVCTLWIWCHRADTARHYCQIWLETPRFAPTFSTIFPLERSNNTGQNRI